MRDYRRQIRVRSDDWLTSELGAGTGLAGRPRPFGDNAERARIAVGKAIRRALVRVTTADPVIGRHLSARLQTGHRCIYHLDQAPR